MKKAIFWDLLGTLGGDSRTLINQEFTFFEEAIPALKKATTHGYLNIIVTNQSHIGHGRITIEEYERALSQLLQQLADNGVQITDVYTCPHTRQEACICKKPKPFLVKEALKKYELESSQCYIIGDSGTNDVMLAYQLQLKSILVLTGEGIRSLTDQRNAWSETSPTHIAENSLDAINKIIGFQIIEQ